MAALDSRVMVMNYLNPFCTEKCINNVNNLKLLNCPCGETGVYDWVWDDNIDDSILLSENQREITFHPVYSAGTAALRGIKPLEKNMHHYWEMKMVSNIYGTDVMIGIGTKDIHTTDWRYRFFSLLGSDENSWGYSYSGKVQHDGVAAVYGSRYGMGSVIGAHLDMYAGTIEFYYNRIPLGVAFRGLKSHELYPMVCSTAAQSSMRLTCSVSTEGGLQLICLKRIVGDATLFEAFKRTPGLMKIFERRFFWLLQREPREAAREIRLHCPVSTEERDAGDWGAQSGEFSDSEGSSSCDMEF